MKGPEGERVIDFRKSNLHVVNYSVPVRARMPLAELQQAPLQPPGSSRLDPVPHVLLHGDLGLLPDATASSSALPEGEYEVVIDSTLEPGSLTYGELLPAAERPRTKS